MSKPVDWSKPIRYKDGDNWVKARVLTTDWKCTAGEGVLVAYPGYLGLDTTVAVNPSTNRAFGVSPVCGYSYVENVPDHTPITADAWDDLIPYDDGTGRFHLSYKGDYGLFVEPETAKDEDGEEVGDDILALSPEALKKWTALIECAPGLKKALENLIDDISKAEIQTYNEETNLGIEGAMQEAHEVLRRLKCF